MSRPDHPARTDRRDFIIRTSAAAWSLALVGPLAACGGGSDDAPPAEFKYGVASGDPLADRVILWTHARVAGRDDAVDLEWQVASDASFANIIRSGTVQALATNGFTAKVDATGLVAGSAYFYRFIDRSGQASPVGTTRTLPADGAASVKLAVFSCSLFSAGFFNAYDAAAKSDALYAVHLGDYIYEYGADPANYGNQNAAALDRVTAPATETLLLDDYRTRYARYRTDAALQALHARMPWIVVWDDHESANNAWTGGAQNHTPASEGDWNARKAAAAKAWHEWLPVRAPDPSDLLKIYRRFDFGRLFTLHMLDTRLEGRDRQYDNFGDADGGLARYLRGVTPDAAGVRADASRRMMSGAQQSWLTSGMAASGATWQLVGNQDIMARMAIPASVLQAQVATPPNPAAVQAAVRDVLTAKAKRVQGAPLTAAEAALLDPAKNPSLPFNLDGWDGYPSQREAILQTVRAQGKRLVVLSGDSHNAWFTRLNTLAGERAGVEFATASVTAPGFESVGLGSLASSLDGSATLGAAAPGKGAGLIDDLDWCDTIRRGYLALTVTAQSVRGEYVFVSTIGSTAYTTSVGRVIGVAADGRIDYD